MPENTVVLFMMARPKDREFEALGMITSSKDREGSVAIIVLMSIFNLRYLLHIVLLKGHFHFLTQGTSSVFFKLPLKYPIGPTCGLLASKNLYSECLQNVTIGTRMAIMSLALH